MHSLEVEVISRSPLDHPMCSGLSYISSTILTRLAHCSGAASLAGSAEPGPPVAGAGVAGALLGHGALGSGPGLVCGHIPLCAQAAANNSAGPASNPGLHLDQNTGTGQELPGFHPAIHLTQNLLACLLTHLLAHLLLELPGFHPSAYLTL